MQELSNVNKDLLASYFREQIGKLNKLLQDLENKDASGTYLDSNLRRVERNLQKLRRAVRQD
jgi:hypothetical protein